MTNEKDTVVRVSIRDIFEEQVAQGKVLQTIAESLPTTAKRFEEVEAKIHDHEVRVRGLERRMWQSIGAFGIIVAVMPWVKDLVIG